MYVIRNTAAGAWLCSCPAGRKGRRCYHVMGAMVRFGGVFTRPAIVIVPATEPDPEPPTPTAPALRACVCVLYGPDPTCAVCGQAAA